MTDTNTSTAEVHEITGAETHCNTCIGLHDTDYCDLTCPARDLRGIALGIEVCQELGIEVSSWTPEDDIDELTDACFDLTCGLSIQVSSDEREFVIVAREGDGFYFEAGRCADDLSRALEGRKAMATFCARRDHQVEGRIVAANSVGEKEDVGRYMSLPYAKLVEAYKAKGGVQ